MSSFFKTVITKTWFRILFGICVPAAAICGILYLQKYGSPFFCITYQTLGIYCTGCGAGRAAYSLVHFKLLQALDYNALFVVCAPFAAYYIIKVYLRVVCGRDILPFFNFSYRASLAILCIVVAFTILRNIPVFPFTVLAP